MTLLKSYQLSQLLMDKRPILFEKWITENQKDNPELKNEFIAKYLKDLFFLLMLAVRDSSSNFKDEFTFLSRKITQALIERNYELSDVLLKLIKLKNTFISLIEAVFPYHPDFKNILIKINDIFDSLNYEAVTYYTNKTKEIAQEKKRCNTIHNQRLTMLGQITSSFVHEFKNPLTSIHGFVQLLQDDYPNMKYLNIISSEIEQLHFQLSQFLSMSKKELVGKKKQPFSLNNLLDGVLNFLYPAFLDANVTVKTDFSKYFKAYGHSDEIRQVILNIILNAIDVLRKQCEKPKINISVCEDDQKHICIIIANNGPMIPHHLQKTIFDPFVTTKKFGTGLGLFICKQIINNHHGIISCRSNLNETQFIIQLPAYTK